MRVESGSDSCAPSYNARISRLTGVGSCASPGDTIPPMTWRIERLRAMSQFRKHLDGGIRTIDPHVRATGGAHPADAFSGGSCYAVKFVFDRPDDSPAKVISIKFALVLVVARAPVVLFS